MDPLCTKMNRMLEHYSLGVMDFNGERRVESFLN